VPTVNALPATVQLLVLAGQERLAGEPPAFVSAQEVEVMPMPHVIVKTWDAAVVMLAPEGEIAAQVGAGGGAVAWIEKLMDASLDPPSK
jgi:hypothetical protein